MVSFVMINFIPSVCQWYYSILTGWFPLYPTALTDPHSMSVLPFLCYLCSSNVHKSCIWRNVYTGVLCSYSVPIPNFAVSCLYACQILLHMIWWLFICYFCFQYLKIFSDILDAYYFHGFLVSGVQYVTICNITVWFRLLENVKKYVTLCLNSPPSLLLVSFL